MLKARLPLFIEKKNLLSIFWGEFEKMYTIDQLLYFLHEITNT